MKNVIINKIRIKLPPKIDKTGNKTHDKAVKKLNKNSKNKTTDDLIIFWQLENILLAAATSTTTVSASSKVF